MPQFKYEARKGPGETSTGTLEAESQRAAVARLREMGFFPLSVEEAEAEEKKDVIREAFRRIRLKERNVFFRQLASLTESGMILTRALRTLVDQTENRKLAALIDQLRDDVQKGNTLAEAMERHPKVFPALYTSLVRAGETGGMLDEVLWRIVAFGEQEEELRGKATSAMVYPIFLLVVGSISIFILISFVFPKFRTVFDQFEADLPLPTEIVMTFCDFMGVWWWAVLLGLAALAGSLMSYVRTDAGRREWDRLMLRVPVLRQVVLKYEMAKFARTLGTLLDNGVPVLLAIRITGETLGNRLVRDEVALIHEGVTEGNAMSDILRESKLFPPMVTSMFAIGEEGGRIGEVSKRVADVYDNEVDRAVKALTSLFEPLLIVVMGIIVGFLVIAMLLPMLTLGSLVSG